jgi:hypothetical protein
MATAYPSIPIPTRDLASLHQAFLAMRQTLSLLTVNQQAPSGATLSKAAQIFATTEHVSKAIKGISLMPGPPGPPGPPGTAAPVHAIPPVFNVPLVDAPDDSTAAAAGVPIGGIYTNGSVLMVRIV